MQNTCRELTKIGRVAKSTQPIITFSLSITQDDDIKVNNGSNAENNSGEEEENKVVIEEICECNG